MRRLRNLLLMSIAAIVASSAVSCNKDKPDYSIMYPNALVTMKTNPEGVVYLQINDKETASVTNFSTMPFKGKSEVRILGNIEKQEGEDSKGFDYAVKINWMDSLRTEVMKPSTGDMDKDNAKYGNAPIEIYADPFFTLVEDGYLTIRFSTVFDGVTKHVLSLVPGEKEDEVILHHDAKNNLSGFRGDGIISFRLDKLKMPDTEKAELKLKWQSFTGVIKEHTFSYVPRKN